MYVYTLMIQSWNVFQGVTIDIEHEILYKLIMDFHLPQRKYSLKFSYFIHDNFVVPQDSKEANGNCQEDQYISLLDIRDIKSQFISIQSQMA